MFVVIYGNPADGFTYVGPFVDGEDANEYADHSLRGETWWVVALEAPSAQRDPIDSAWDRGPDAVPLDRSTEVRFGPEGARIHRRERSYTTEGGTRDERLRTTD